MLELELTFRKLDFKFQKWKQALQASLEVEVTGAMREAMREVVQRIPVYTGEARGTLKPIGRFLDLQIPITPVGRKKGHDQDTGAANSSIKFDLSTPLRPTFKVNITLFHLEWNEFNESKISPSAPWHAFEAGRRAFQAYLLHNLKRNVPRIRAYTTKTKLETS